MRKFKFNEAIRRLGKLAMQMGRFLASLVQTEDRELLSKVVSKCITSAIIFMLLLAGSYFSAWLSAVLVAAQPGMKLEAALLNIASVVLLTIDLIWLIAKAIEGLLALLRRRS